RRRAHRRRRMDQRLTCPAWSSIVDVIGAGDGKSAAQRRRVTSRVDTQATARIQRGHTMRTYRSHILTTTAVAAALVGLSACVPSANGGKKSITTLDPLSVALVTTTSTSTTTSLPGSGAVIITAGTVIQPTSPPTLVPPADTVSGNGTGSATGSATA